MHAAVQGEKTDVSSLPPTMLFLKNMVRRCNRTLQGYEEKLHLIRRFMQARENVIRLQELTEDLELTREELITQVRQLTGQILEEL